MIDDKEPLDAPIEDLYPQPVVTNKFAPAQSMDYRLHKIQQRRKEHKRQHEEEEA